MPPSAENTDMLLAAINAKIEPIVRQLERIEERTQNIVTRSDLEVLRKELVTRDAFEPQLNALKAQIARTEADRVEDKKALEQQIDDLKDEQLGRQDRLWMRVSQAVGVLAFALALFDLIAHLKFIP